MEKTEASVLPVLADARQLFAVGFIILVSSGLRRERALAQKGTSSVFTVTIINLDDLKNYPSYQSRTIATRGQYNTTHEAEPSSCAV